MTYFKLDFESEAEAVHRTVHASYQALEDVATRRAKDPDSYPLVPRTRVAEWFAKRLLASLVDAGFRPEKWEEVFIKESLLAGKEEDK